MLKTMGSAITVQLADYSKTDLTEELKIATYQLRE